MTITTRTAWAAVAVVAGGALTFGQPAVPPTNDLPNPYQTD